MLPCAKPTDGPDLKNCPDFLLGVSWDKPDLQARGFMPTRSPNPEALFHALNSTNRRKITRPAKLVDLWGSLVANGAICDSPYGGVVTISRLARGEHLFYMFPTAYTCRRGSPHSIGEQGGVCLYNSKIDYHLAMLKSADVHPCSALTLTSDIKWANCAMLRTTAIVAIKEINRQTDQNGLPTAHRVSILHPEKLVCYLGDWTFCEHNHRQKSILEPPL